MNNQTLKNLISDIEDMTNRNDHTGSLLLLANESYPFDNSYQALLSAIQTEQNRKGCMTPMLLEIRRVLYKRIMADLETMVTSSEYDQIHGAF